MNPLPRTPSMPDAPASPPAAVPSPSALAPGTAATGLEPERRTGHCQCGHIAYEVLGTPDDPHLCSCEHETRISGGPAVLWVGFRKDGLTWTGPGHEPTWFATYTTLKRGFCPRCGTHVISVAAGSDMIMVTGFSLTDQTGIEPVGHSYREMAARWMTITLAPDPRAPQPATS
ncbi:GFA family protein [Streptomyces sp. NBC_01142]|uniref:GFA family protein n=1 Tax=Streptomyces sp. NBC_01142 TaxID=2975865 RepID=UPI00224ED7B8|nr:GFA family protein [Streptomyces sp. NBC_01142]MCX4826502.1 GFA family protein [Streptomyces sp. NBC_01142]